MRTLTRLWIGLAAVVSATFLAFPAAAAPVAPTLQISPPPSGGYADGQTIDISAGPNAFFTFGNLVNILECGDPGGKTANLPRDESDCDGLTIQPTTVAINHDGSFSLKGYVVYALPNTKVLEEPKDSLPICNATHACVLYVGENQSDFTEHHEFSAPFFVGSHADAAGGGGSSPTVPVLVGVAAVVLVAGALFLVRVRRRTGPATQSRRSA
jgi:hypothetical protein